MEIDKHFDILNDFNISESNLNENQAPISAVSDNDKIISFLQENLSANHPLGK